MATREVIARPVVRRRLLFVLFALGTNMGIKKLADALTGSGDASDTEAALRRTRWTYVNRDNLRRAIVRVVNATFAGRDNVWGEGTACASDSTSTKSRTRPVGAGRRGYGFNLRPRERWRLSSPRCLPGCWKRSRGRGERWPGRLWARAR